MRVTSFGMFWRESEIDWHPGQGNKGRFHLIGRVGSNTGHVQLADFRRQQGIYILYDEYGPVYTGLTRDQGLGKRLKDHKEDHLSGKWDRFSWFGFYPLGSIGKRGIRSVDEQTEDVVEETGTSIGDLEALLIKVINPKLNKAKMKFHGAKEWIQVPFDDVDLFRSRVMNSAD